MASETAEVEQGSALSWREKTVVAHVAAGMSNKEIGEILFLSEMTIKSHLMRISKKLGARNRAHVVFLAMKAGVIQ